MSSQGVVHVPDIIKFSSQSKGGIFDYFGIRGKAVVTGRTSVIAVSGSSVVLQMSHSVDNVEEFITLAFLQEGHFDYMENDNWIHSESRIIMIPSGVVNQIRFPEDWKALLIQLPQESIDSMTPYPLRKVQKFDKTTALENAMCAFATSINTTNSELSAVEAYAVEQLLQEMAGATLLDRVGGFFKRDSPRVVLLDSARAVIAQQCADPYLTPNIVAAEVSSSLRQLQSVFSAAGTTVAGEIRSRRALLARDLLIDSRYDVLTVEEIAQRSGFGNSKSLRRALLTIYGTGPREIRNQSGLTQPNG
ncbi:helix-turn-helix domain-containing protein [Glutamicibacter arilaitensis]|uniref:helix-turn-helix domain-containing protein n=1 Tax=Glutamicibacter arilaitensis TaxID=256701 RepID=UPI003FD117EF